MTTKTEAEHKIAAAVKACAKVLEARRAAYTTLDGSVITNGYGIFHDHFAVRQMLEAARAHVQEALQALNDVDFPSDAEYDQL